MIAYIIGIFSVGMLPALPSTTVLVALLLAALLLIRALPVLTYLLLGISVGVFWGHTQLASRLDISQAGRYEIVGEITTPVAVKPDFQRFQLKVIQANRAPDLIGRTLRLSAYHDTNVLHQHDRITTTVSVKPPQGGANPRQFDFERWALVNGIDGVGYARDIEIQHSHESRVIVRIRDAITALIKHFPSLDQRTNATLIALLLGDKQYLDTSAWEVMQATGTVHLIVVSGLHIGICVAFGWWLGRSLQSLLLLAGVRWLYRLPAITALCVSGGYVMLAGFSIPAMRAWIMAAVFLGGWLIGQARCLWQRFWLAMASVLTLSPLAYWEVGFWLSFSAVAVLIYLSEQRYQSVSSGLAIAWRSQVAIFLMMTPLLAYIFGIVTLLGPLVNIVAIPLMAIILPGVFLSVALALLGDVITPLSWLISAITKGWELLSWLAEQGSMLQLTHVHLSKTALILALLGSLLWLIPFTRLTKLIGLLCYVLAFQPRTPLPQGRFEAQVFDVGQGTAVLIKTAQHALLYDTGRSYKSGHSAFLSAILPALQYDGTARLDKVVISHADNDHAGGLAHVLATLPVDRLESGMPESIIGNAISCHHVPPWQWNGVQFRYIAPTYQPTHRNDRSCILEVRSTTCALLLTGDASQEVERNILDVLKPVHWLLLGHHGSKTATSHAILERVQPSIGIVSAGFLNPYHHPHPSVVERVNAHHAAIWRTDRQGMISLRDKVEHGCTTTGWRDKHLKYWSITS